MSTFLENIGNKCVTADLNRKGLILLENLFKPPQSRLVVDMLLTWSVLSAASKQ